MGNWSGLFAVTNGLGALATRLAGVNGSIAKIDMAAIENANKKIMKLGEDVSDLDREWAEVKARYHAMATEQPHTQGGAIPANTIEPNSRNDQPPAPFGGVPNFSRSTGSGWNAGVPGAPGSATNPAIFIPADFSEGARQRREQRAGGWNQQAADAVIAQLEQLHARMDQVFGGPTFVGQLIENEIANIKAKVLSPDEALAFMRYVLGTMSAGLQQEALSPVSSIRNVANDLLRFAGGAGLPGGAGSLTPGQRAALPPTEREAGASTVAGIGGATRADVVGLGATISGQVAGIRAGIAAATTAVTASAAKTDNVFRTIQQNHIEANRALAAQLAHDRVEANRALAEQFRHVTDGPLRRIERGIHTMPQFSPGDLAQALQRMNLSGQLSSQAAP